MQSFSLCEALFWQTSINFGNNEDDFVRFALRCTMIKFVNFFSRIFQEVFSNYEIVPRIARENQTFLAHSLWIGQLIMLSIVRISFLPTASNKPTIINKKHKYANC